MAIYACPDIYREHPSIHKYGKLETALSASGILKTWRASRPSPRRPRVVHFADIWDLAASDDRAAKRMLRQRATILADVIVDFALILNPNLILLGGEVGNHPALLREVNRLLEGSEFTVLRLALGALDIPAALSGAVSMSLEPTVLRLLHSSCQG